MSRAIANIVNQSNALEIVRQMPPQDLFLIIKDTGLSDSLELLELMSPQQIKICLDLDGWQGHEIRPQLISHWFEAISAVNPRKFAQIFKELDIELVSLLLKRYAHIYDLSAEEEPGDITGEYMTTPDQRYLIAFTDDAPDQNLIHFLKQALEQLYARDMAFVVRLIEGVRWETASMLEEEALHWRDGRMQELGFAPFEEAHQILTYVNPASFDLHARVNITHETASSSLLLNGIPKESIFAQALSRLDINSQLRVQNELVTTSNRVHVALGRDIGDVDLLKNTVTYTIHVVETALSYLASNDCFERLCVQQLFQIGHSLALKIGRDFRSTITKTKITVDDLKRLDHPLAEVVRGVLQPQPLFFAGLSDVKRIDYRYFESLDDVVSTTSAVAEALFRIVLLGPQHLTLSHGVLLGTILSHLVLGQAADTSPLNSQDLTRLRDRLEVVGEGKRFSAADVEKCQSWILKSVTSNEAQTRAKQYVRVVMGAIENELSRIADSEVDPRFIASIQVQGKATTKSDTTSV